MDVWAIALEFLLFIGNLYFAIVAKQKSSRWMHGIISGCMLISSIAHIVNYVQG